jgi:hypothetical protein
LYRERCSKGLPDKTGSPFCQGVQIANAAALIREQAFEGFDTFEAEGPSNPAASTRFAVFSLRVVSIQTAASPCMAESDALYAL